MSALRRRQEQNLLLQVRRQIKHVHDLRQPSSSDVPQASLTYTGVVAGTPHYMSPEQANGEPTDHQTDQFSFGAVLSFIATGHPPFRAERAMGVLNRICHEPHRTVWHVNNAIPDELSEIIDRLLEKKPTRSRSILPLAPGRAASMTKVAGAGSTV